MTALQGLSLLFGAVPIAPAARWLVARPLRLLTLILLVACLWLWIGRDQARGLAEDRRVQAAGWQARFSAQKAEMVKFAAMVAAARQDAARRDRENIERVERQWAGQLQEVTHDYQADVAAARAALGERLRIAGAGAKGGAGGGGGAAMSGLPVLSGGPVRPGRAAIVDDADLLACAINTLKLEHLIDAWGRAASIEVNRQP